MVSQRSVIECRGDEEECNDQCPAIKRDLSRLKKEGFI